MFKQVELTPAEESMWMKSRTVLTWSAPAFSHIFYTLLNNSGSRHIAFFTEDVPTAATDGSNLILNPKQFFKHTLQEQAFIVCHEVLHNVFDHPRIFTRMMEEGFVKYPDGTKLPFVEKLMQIAADLHINDILVTTGVGKYNPAWWHDRSLGTKDMAVVDIYRKLHSSFNGKNERSFDQVLKPGVTSQGNVQHRNPIQWQTVIAAAANLAKEQSRNMLRNQGLLALDLARTLDKVNEPVVTWEDKFHSLFSRKVGAGGYDWRRADRRFMSRGIYVPARSRFEAGDVVVANDTSGSMNETEIAMCFSEIGGILEQIRPRRLFVLWCDAKVHRVDELEDVGDLYEIKKKGAPGGGGTNFIPVFDWIKENCWNMPDALVFFTDGYGKFPQEAPTYPVFWGSITPNQHYPFGDIIDIPMGKHYHN